MSNNPKIEVMTIKNSSTYFKKVAQHENKKVLNLETDKNASYSKLVGSIGAILRISSKYLQNSCVMDTVDEIDLSDVAGLLNMANEMLPVDEAELLDKMQNQIIDKRLKVSN
ncbi:hypothetical protein [Tenacibaculum maritimum]|uniref:hypothetical protein n=1 Tax=Tenacibaculum maritimum TaxID=107401 RepID=UPI0012E660C6|nr:hypothetical protein [Tenacibaculum maritimum]CAA0211146.1 hypothetical protein DPIF8902391_30031 [Tenacibaculum maritimum]